MKKVNLILYLGISFIITTQIFADAQDDLFTAAMQCDVEGVNKAISGGVDINALHSSGQNALAMAFLCPEVTEILLEKGCDPNGGNYPAIISAANNYSIEVIELLLEGGADINIGAVVDPGAALRKMLADEKAKGKKANKDMVKAWESALKNMKPTKVYALQNLVQQTNCVPCLQMFVNKGVDFGVYEDGNVLHHFATYTQSADQRKAGFAQGKTAMEGFGIKVPDWYGNLGPDRNGSAVDMFDVLMTQNPDLEQKNGAGVTPLDLANAGLNATPEGQASKQAVVDAMLAILDPDGSLDLTGKFDSDLANATADISKIKAKPDWPAEGRTSKKGGGWSVNPTLLGSAPKKIALVTFYLEDPGSADMSKTESADMVYTKTEIWTTSDAKADQHVTGFYNNGIAAMIEAFARYDMQILLPEEFLDTEEKKTFYENFEVQHGRLKKTKGEMKFAGLALDRYRATAAGYKTIPIANERTNNYESIYNYLMDSNESAFFQSMGYDLATGLDVDAVLVVCLVTRKMFREKEDYALNHASMYMFGPNPIQLSEEEDQGIKGVFYVRGQFYCGSRVNYKKPIYFQESGKKGTPGGQPLYTGMDNILVSLTDKIGEYFEKRLAN